MIAATRVFLGAGLGLLLGERLNADQRKAAGWTLFAIGAISTIPLGFEVLGGRRIAPSEPEAGFQVREAA